MTDTDTVTVTATDTHTSGDAVGKSATACSQAPPRAPRMQWWQTPTHVMVRVTMPDAPTAANAQVHITEKALQIDATCMSTGHRYEVCAPWYRAVDAKASSRSQATPDSRQITVVARKSDPHDEEVDDDEDDVGEGAVYVSWPHPFADRMYKSVVSVDWEHWQEAPSDEDENVEADSNSDDDDDDEPLGALTPATLAEFCKADAAPCEPSGSEGTNDTEGIAHGLLPTEADPDFQRMIASLEDFGTRTSSTLASASSSVPPASSEDTPSTLEQIMQQPQMDKPELMSLLESLRSKDMTGTDGVCGLELEQLREQLEEVSLEPEE